jgi:secreted PhoX family phosphatase
MTRITLLATTALVAISSGPISKAEAADTLTFTAIQAPTTDQEKREVRATPEITLGGKSTKIGFVPLLRSGDKLGSGTFGLILDEKGVPIVGEDGAPMISNAADFSSLLHKDGNLYVVSQFETRPAAVYVTRTDFDRDTGALKATDTAPVDFSSSGGLWVPCAGSLTPWGTHLGSEEYEPDARVIETTADLAELDDYAKPMALYFGYDAMSKATHPTMDGFREVFKPYRYGYITEVSIDDAGKASGVKHYAMGRFSHELGYVMPDQKTVYMADDGTNVGLFRFVADEPGKLDKGRLYAAKWQQTSAEGGGSADLSWVDLGEADSDAVKALIDKGTKFSDIFEAADMADDGSCPQGFTASAANGVKECLKVKDGMELAASRLETRRYAAIKGATTEIRKEEGITYDPDHHRLYVAISEISNGMEDAASKGKPSGKYDLAAANDIKVAYNPCGGVYALDLDDDFVATNMTALVTGTPKTYGDDSPFAGNTCDMDGLANPDNITYVPGHDTLIIGEDTESGHQNDAVWAYDLDARTLTRIETTPYGAETTSVYIYPDIEGHAYLMSVVQHPYGESDEDKLKSPADAQAYVGYIGPMPKLD